MTPLFKVRGGNILKTQLAVDYRKYFIIIHLDFIMIYDIINPQFLGIRLVLFAKKKNVIALIYKGHIFQGIRSTLKTSSL